MINGTKLLLVEDDQSFGYVLSKYLGINQIDVTWAKSGDEGSDLIKEYRFDLGILDIMLPEKDGFELAQEWIKWQENSPFVFLTSKSLKIDKLQGYKLGCIDYIVKPIEEEVFIAKIRALLRKSSKTTNSPVYIGKYQFDVANNQLKINGTKDRLTERETQILFMLYENRNQVVTRQSFLKELWGKSDYFNRKSMDVFIFKLRKYLSKDPEVKITNIHGKGFILEIGET